LVRPHSQFFSKYIANRTNAHAYPRKQSDQENWQVIPEWLDVLEFGSKEALEIVLDDEDAEKVGVAASAENVPRERGEEEGRNRSGVNEPEGVAPALGEERPEKNGAAAKNNGGGAFCKNGEAEEKTEQN